MAEVGNDDALLWTPQTRAHLRLERQGVRPYDAQHELAADHTSAGAGSSISTGGR